MFKLKTEDEKKGVWINEKEFLDIMNILYERNKKLYNKLKSDYEFLTNNKFNEEWIRKKKIV